MARARDHPVVDLKHIKRSRKVEHVDREAEDQCVDEIAAAAVEDPTQVIGFGLCRHVNYKVCCGGISAWRTFPVLIRCCTTVIKAQKGATFGEGRRHLPIAR